MGSLAGVMLTQHVDLGQSGRHNVSTWTMGSLAGVTTQQHVDHLYITPPRLQLLKALHNLGCGVFFLSR